MIAELYWIPKDMDPWNSIDHPVLSLLLRRYFGIERPIYYEDEDENKNADLKNSWNVVCHHTTNLDILNKADTNREYMRWAVSKEYTFRYFNPYKSKYSGNPEPDNYIEYCGLSMTMRKHSFFHIDRDKSM